LPIDLFQRLVISTASVTVLRLTPHGARLLLMNGTDRIPPPPEGKASGGDDDKKER
jgi:hypothetical protein